MTKFVDGYKGASKDRAEGGRGAKITFTKIIQELFPTLLSESTV
jgi:hypothetical protein